MYARDKRNINNECNKTFESFAVQYTLIIHTNTLYIFKLILLVSFFICIHVTFTRYKILSHWGLLDFKILKRLNFIKIS